MKKIPITATTGKKGTPDFKEIKGEAPQYESVAEAVKTLKEEGALSLINRQAYTDALNKLRKPVADPIASMIKKAPPEARDAIAAILAKHGLKAS